MFLFRVLLASDFEEADDDDVCVEDRVSPAFSEHSRVNMGR